jgi:type IV fimbrial biogenesis protein FimT
MLIMCSTRKSSGFTLIELLIVVAITVVLAALAIPSFTQMIQNSRIRAASDSVLNGIQVARAEAVKRNARVQFDFRTNSAWSVCTAPVAPGACPSPDNATTIQSRSFGDGSSADVSVATSNNGPFIFNGLGALTSPLPTAANGLVSINLNSVASPVNSRKLRVVIGAGGVVKLCDPTLSTTGTDPRRCPA